VRAQSSTRLAVSRHGCRKGAPGDERGERRAEADVLDAEVEQRQQDADGFLLVPREDQRERQVVSGKSLTPQLNSATSGNRFTTTSRSARMPAPSNKLVLRQPSSGGPRSVVADCRKWTRRSASLQTALLSSFASSLSVGLTVNPISGKMRPRKEWKCNERKISQASPTLRPVRRGSGLLP